MIPTINPTTYPGLVVVSHQGLSWFMGAQDVERLIATLEQEQLEQWHNLDSHHGLLR